ncbi:MULTISPECIES: ABC transporter substrate-binding protein [Bradyrhizobium]|uniref:ABC transport system substrate-binding protein n=1 Tax=Bradyrhizobium canariense TaxID=255045 RepID=A0A1X3FZH9_9BRAD|nr:MULTISPECIES: ABC transporter substrate-binding protein [Bradyrhizobium]OSI71616.1 hypothetical protein BSZ22_11050 [Bradyrhizobium canariense]OSI80578.1 hypothetical protein BSZ23_10765 [Bradyrhizobium canariense]OSI91181.1 hypothetical protein BSZ25_16335 [Bradyrhizobium canariense]OSI96254.1 hypothetical protein BSZ24_05150 [Bradyrhizobium canariense]OSJ09234.1 hypothetical protein BSZ16_06970 [Bradyrhizobium canariense]
MGLSGPPQYRAFFEELSRLAYVEGQNLVIDRYSGEGRPERYSELVRDVINTHPDLILAVAARLSLDFKTATTTIPIVTIVNDPVALRLVASIARRAATSQATIATELELIGKRIELLVEALPGLSTLGYLVSRSYWEDLRGAAARGSQTSRYFAEGCPAGQRLLPDRVPAGLQIDGTDALMVSDEAEHLATGAAIVELAATGRIPTMYAYGEYVRLGGLMAYSIDLPETFRRLATLIDKVLKGSSPGDIPFYRPTKFELSINLTTAKALGLALPAILLVRAGQVVE